MFRVAVLLLTLAVTADVGQHSPFAAWPLRAFVTGAHGRPVSFSAVTLGGDLIIKVGGNDYMPVVRALARGDTVHATTPAQYPLDLRAGPVAFFTGSRDSIRVVVGRNPFGAYDRVAGEGRHLMVRLVDSTVVIDAR